MNSSDHVNPVLQAWCDTPSHFLPQSELAAAVVQQTDTTGPRPRQPRYSPAEISQYSVDLLLREYYRMVHEQRQVQQRQRDDGSGGGMLKQAFLLLCPSAPDCCDLDNVVKAAVVLVQLTAKVTVLGACVLLPLWLLAVRQVLQHQGCVSAAVLAAGGIAFFLVADVITRSTEANKSAAAAALVTSENLQQQLITSSLSNELATLRAASKTATTSNTSRPTSMTLQAARHQQQQLAAPAPPAQPAATAAVATSPGHRSSSTVTTTTTSSPAAPYAPLLPDLIALQTAVGVSSSHSSSHTPGSRQHVEVALGQLCQVLGLPLTSEMAASPAVAAASIAQLKRHVGI